MLLKPTTLRSSLRTARVPRTLPIRTFTSSSVASQQQEHHPPHPRYHSTTAHSLSSTAHSTLHPPTHSPTSIFKPLDVFAPRHIGPRGPSTTSTSTTTSFPSSPFQTDEISAMLQTLNYSSMDEFISATVPESIRIKELGDVKSEGGIEALSELELLRRAERLGEVNESVKSYIGMG